MKKIKLATDFDGVIGETHAQLCDIASIALNREICTQDITHYDIAKAFNISKEQSDSIIRCLLNTKNTLSVEPIPGSIKFLRKWYKITGKLIIITTRREADGLYSFFDTYMPGMDVCILSSHKKGELCKELGITHFIDDCIDNIIDLANNGIIPIIYDQPWNQFLPHRALLSKLACRVHSWSDISKRFLPH